MKSNRRGNRGKCVGAAATLTAATLALAIGWRSAEDGLSAQTRETGFLNRLVTLEGAEFRYQVYVPREYAPATKWPVILALHGGGEYGRDGLLHTDGGLARAIRRHAERFPAIVVFPQSPPGGTPGFQAFGGRLALAALDKTLGEFSADPARIYVTGLSMGGNGAWYLVYHHAERFAAALVVCGFVDAFTGRTSGIPYPPIVPGSADPYAAIAQKVSGLPIWIFHGDADATVAVEQSRRMTEALKAAGANVQYTELPGVGHNAWDPAYDRADVMTWLLAQRRR